MLALQKNKKEQRAGRAELWKGSRAASSPEAREQRAGIDDKRDDINWVRQTFKREKRKLEEWRGQKQASCLRCATGMHKKLMRGWVTCRFIWHHELSLCRFFLFFLQESARDITKGFISRETSASWNETPSNLLGIRRAQITTSTV